MGRPAAVKTGSDRAEYLQDKLRESVMERRRLAAAQAGMPETAKSSSGATMTNNDVQDHIKSYVQQKGSWIERRIARLQSEVKDTSR
jgi:gas vesicle protein